MARRFIFNEIYYNAKVNCNVTKLILNKRFSSYRYIKMLEGTSSRAKGQQLFNEGLRNTFFKICFSNFKYVID
jgi:hypothetical protein